MSNILKDALNAVKAQETLTRLGGGEQQWPESYEKCSETLCKLDLCDTSNAVQHKIFSWVWQSLFYKTWLYYKKTYILDTEFFSTLTTQKSVRIYPSVFKTLPFKTFAVDLSGSELFNGYILCNFNINDDGIYCSFYAHPFDDPNNEKQFGVFLDIKEMIADDDNENGELYFILDPESEEDKDITFFRSPRLIDSFKNIFTKKIKPSYEEYKEVLPNFIHDGDEEKLEKLEQEYFKKLKEVNDKTEWFILKKALIQFAYYLCTPEPDVKENYETRKNIKRAEKLKKKTEFEYKYTVGSRVGVRIRLDKVILNDIEEEVEYRKGTVKCPHVRGAHWTHVWCGHKGDQHIEARFIDVTFVNADLGNIDEVCNEVSNRVRQNWEGENLICRKLDALGIRYKRQASIIVDNHRYRFDVSIRLNGQLKYIEFDGEQHFRPVSIFGGEEGFKRTREADTIKNNYCKQKKIPLLRVSYKNKGNIDAMVENFCKQDNMTYEYKEEYYKDCV